MDRQTDRQKKDRQIDRLREGVVRLRLCEFKRP